MDNKRKRNQKNLIRTSLFVFWLTKFSSWIYSCILSGFFGWLFTSYRSISKGFSSSYLWTKGSALISNMKENPLKRAKYSVAKLYEQSFFLHAIRSAFHGFLTMHVNSLGLCFFSYGICIFGIQAIRFYTANASLEMLYRPLLVSVTFIFLGVLMFFSKKSIASTIYESKTARFLLVDLLGYQMHRIAEAAKEDSRRGFNPPLLLGLALGGLTVFVDPMFFPAVFAGMILFAIILNSPESAIILVFLTLPFLTTMQLVLIMCLTYIAFLLKLLCGRRIFRLRLIDFAAIAFMIFVFFGGIFSVDASSFPKMCVFLCFMLSYFVVKNTLGSQALVKRCICALIASGVIVSLIGLYQNFFGTLSEKWLDHTVFTEIKGRVVSTFDNPNVLGEYLILVFPLILAMMITEKRSNLKFAYFIAAVLNCSCLVFTWSRGAWLGFLFSLLIFFAVSGKHFLTVTILSLPVLNIGLYFASNTSIFHRFTNLSDSSSSYRFNIWRGVFNMLENIGLYGIGIGEGAFRMVYPGYSLAGIEAAPHSHNLFLQILVETGIFSLIAFLIFLFFYAQCSLGFCKTAYTPSNKTICLAFFAGISAFLIQGMTDYVWYNYRIFLLFWMILGLAIAHIRTSNATEEECFPYEYQ